MNRRLLIVAPHFAPISAPDGQRARMLVPHFHELGWQPHLLTVDPAGSDAPLESDLLQTLPPDLPVTRVSAISTQRSRLLGLGNIAWRAWPALKAAGDRLLAGQRFDLIYFSTTQFACLPLGRLWQRAHDVPYVIDLQDPWRSDYEHAPGTRPPGGWKYRFASLQARLLEPWTLRHCAGVIAVSPAYLDALARRYRWWQPVRGRSIPMGWSERDFDVALKLSPPGAIDPSLIRYIGRLGPDLERTLEVFLAGFALARQQAPASALRCDFRGGSYAPGVTAGPVGRIARQLHVSAAVEENASRIPYLASLAALRTAGANLILGSDDRGYAPSKVWLTLAARRPWLALAHRGTVLHHLLFPHVGAAGRLVDPGDPDASAAVADFCLSLDRSATGCADDRLLATFETRELARLHADFFARLIEPR